jgi:hypothetical protein
VIGSTSPPEWKEFPDPDTGRKVTQLTNGRGHSYPLYYFVPSITTNQRFLIFHSERSGWVQLYRLNLGNGEIAQLTDGHTADSGWAPWCEWRQPSQRHLQDQRMEEGVERSRPLLRRADHRKLESDRRPTHKDPDRPG